MRHRRPGCRRGGSPHRGPTASTSSIRFRAEEVALVLLREAVRGLPARRAAVAFELHPDGKRERQRRRIDARSLGLGLNQGGAVRAGLENELLEGGPRLVLPAEALFVLGPAWLGAARAPRRDRD